MKFIKVIKTFSLLLIASYSQASEILWDAGGDATSWSDVNNWDCNCLPTANDTVTIQFGTLTLTGAQHAKWLKLWSTLTINGSASLTISDQFDIKFTADLINHGTLHFTSGIFQMEASNDGSGNPYHNTFTNHGAVIFDPSAHMECITSIASTGTNTVHNYGTMTFTNGGYLALRIHEFTTFINHTDAILQLNEASGIRIWAGDFQNSGDITGDGTICLLFGSSMTNTSNGSIHLDDFTNLPMSEGVNQACIQLKANTTFTNQGSITLSSPSASGTHGIRLDANAIFQSTGSVHVTALHYPLYNAGTATFDGETQLHTTQINAANGVINENVLAFGASPTGVSITGYLRNSESTSNITIGACRNVSITDGNITNSLGSFLNDGIITFNANLISVTNTSPINNTGMLINNPFPTTLPIAENQGLFSQRIIGQHCVGSVIPNIVTGALVGIVNTSSIFTDPGLTIPAGTLDIVARTFNPSAAAVSVSTFYISFQKTGCPDIVIPIIFQYPIANVSTWYSDADFDGYGLTSSAVVSCLSPGFSYVLVGGDCNDNDYNINPGAIDACSDQDYNCDGLISNSAPGPATWYRDMDFDGYGRNSVTVVSCFQPLGYSALGGDCNDDNWEINPGVTNETSLCNDEDYDCDGIIEGTIMSVVHYRDEDGDGYGDPNVSDLKCGPVYGWVTDNTDCNDNFFNVNTSAIEILDGLDNNCDGTIDEGFTIEDTHFLGTVDTDWSNAANWDNGIPTFAKRAYIQSNAVLLSSTATEARSIIIDPGITLTIQNSNVYIKGENLVNRGNISIENSNVIIENVAIGNAIYNSGVFVLNGGSLGILNCIFGVTNSSNFTIMTGTSVNISICNVGISNNGTFNLQGYLSATKIQGEFIRNYNQFTIGNQGTIDLQNATKTLSWFLANYSNFNGDTFTNHGLIRFPTVSAAAINSADGILNVQGAILNNYGSIQFFGQRILSPGLLINHGPNGLIEGMAP